MIIRKLLILPACISMFSPTAAQAVDCVTGPAPILPFNESLEEEYEDFSHQATAAANRMKRGMEKGLYDAEDVGHHIRQNNLKREQLHQELMKEVHRYNRSLDRYDTEQEWYYANCP